MTRRKIIIAAALLALLIAGAIFFLSVLGSPVEPFPPDAAAGDEPMNAADTELDAASNADSDCTDCERRPQAEDLAVAPGGNEDAPRPSSRGADQ